jgi:hypothetical protein
MSQIHAELERPIAAPASQVYAYFADYREHHPRLLPSAFSDNRVEQGGIGAGTVVSFKTTVAGRTQSYRVYVTEPVPGRVMVETDPELKLVTTFTVTPDGDHCKVKLETTYEGSSGIAGFFERLLAPRLLRKLYAEELAITDRYARERTGAGQQSPLGQAAS